jgi:geranylgeranyl diphosphate synthase, type I
MSFFSPSIEDLKAMVDAELHRFLEVRRRTLSDAKPLIDEILRTVDAGGKRLRPAFCYWGFRGSGGKHCDAIVRVAASLELLHTFAVVHDDIMDESSERRGVPTTLALHGVSFALLVGDLALVLADDLIMASGFPSGVIAGAFEAYSRMRQEVIAGQYLDLESAADPSTTEARARRVAVLKSGRYSIQEPLAIGAALAGAPGEVARALARFGEPLGEAFQLRDDLLGTFGDRASIGKPVDSDIREGKRHVLYAKTVAGLEELEGREFASLWGGGEALSAQQVARARRLVEVSGARSATERLLEELSGMASERLRALPVGGEARAALAALASEATDRQR